MAKRKNNTTMLMVLAVAAFLFIGGSPTGNYLSDYQTGFDVSLKSCPQEGKMDCYYEPTVGWWSRECVDFRWRKVDYCGDLRSFGDSSCRYKKTGMGRSTDPTVTICQNPHLVEEGGPGWQPYVNPQ